MRLSLPVLLVIASSVQGAEILSLRIANEEIPAGGIVQLKLQLTEPKPISTGVASIDTDERFSELEGAAMFGPQDDVYGAALVRNGRIQVTFSSRSGTLGMSPDGDYPVLTLALRLSPHVPAGTVIQARLDQAASWFSPLLGAPYDVEVKPGRITVGTGPSIDNVIPGSAVVPAGGVVTVVGTNFVPGIRIAANETRSETVFRSPSQVDLLLKEPADMHGRRLRAVQPAGNRVTYFSYRRTARFEVSDNELLAATYPVFPRKEARVIAVEIPPLRQGQVFGLALSNGGETPATLVLEALAADGKGLGSKSLVLPPNSRTVRAADEFFAVAEAALWRVISDVSVQAMGLVADPEAGAVVPVSAVSAR